MTDWLPYIRDLADAMGLKDWTFKIDDRPADDDADADADAQIRCIYGQRRAVIRLCVGFDGYDAEKQRGILTHELIHPHIDPIDTVTRNMEPLIGRPAWTIFNGAMDDAIENATDAIAVVLAPFLPLPPIDEQVQEVA
jgi:hypothetical protein